MTEAETPARLSERGWALEQAGDWSAAAEAYSAAFHAGVREGAVEVVVDAARGGARIRNWQGRHDEAEELAGLSEAIAVAHGLRSAAARATHVRAIIRFARNDLEGARLLYASALEQAHQVHDDALIGFASQNLGVVANIQGDLREARALYLESIAATIRTGDRHAALNAYNNLGMACSDLREWLEADLYFDRGIEIAERLANQAMLARLHLNRAEPLIQMGELARASRALERAEEAAERTLDREVPVAVMRFRGIIARLEGDPAAADDYLRRALTRAEEAGLELERAEILGGLARLRWFQGLRGEARAALHEARARFAALGAAREIRRLDEVLVGWEVAV